MDYDKNERLEEGGVSSQVLHSFLDRSGELGPAHHEELASYVNHILAFGARLEKLQAGTLVAFVFLLTWPSKTDELEFESWRLCGTGQCKSNLISSRSRALNTIGSGIREGQKSHSCQVGRASCTLTDGDMGVRLESADT